MCKGGKNCLFKTLPCRPPLVLVSRHVVYARLYIFVETLNDVKRQFPRNPYSVTYRLRSPNCAIGGNCIA